MELSHNHKRCKFEFEFNIDMDNSADGWTMILVNGKEVKFNYSRISAKGYPVGFKFSTILHDEIIPCFALFYGGNSGVTTSTDKLTIYSTFFVVEQNDWFPKGTINSVLRDNFEIFPGSIRRMDISYDTSLPLPELIKRFDKNVKFHSEIGDDAKYSGYFQTYYTSSVQNSTNRTRQVRIYDKILDSFKKKKTFLFPHLKGKGEVRRIELELRPDYCKRIMMSPFDIIDNLDNVLGKIFQKNMAKYSSFYSSVDIPDLLPYQKRGEGKLKEVFLQTGQIPQDYMARVNGYSSSIYENCGWRGMYQVFTGANFDYANVLDMKTRTKRIIPTERDPMECLDGFIRYLIDDLGYPQWRVWKQVQKFKALPRFFENDPSA